MTEAMRTRADMHNPRRATRAGLIGVLLAALFLAGCPYSAALQKGDDLAAQGRWGQALDAYERALDLDPNSEEAATKAAQARAAAAQQALDDAEAHLSARRWRKAHASVLAAERLIPGLERGAQIDARNLESVCEAAEVSLQQGDVPNAYDRVSIALELYPNAPAALALQSRTRGRALDDARAMSDRGEFADAIARAELILKHDPAGRPQATAVLDDARQRWASALRQAATQDLRRRHEAVALVRYAQAAALVGDPSDRAQRDRLRQSLRDSGSFSVALNVRGDRLRAARLRNSAAQALRDLPAVAIAKRAGDATLDVRVAIPDATCDETSTTRTNGHRYVSGTRKVKNPAWVRIQEDLIAAREDSTRAASRALAAQSSAQRAQRDADRIRRDDLPRLQEALDQATRRHQRAQKRTGALRSNVDRARNALNTQAARPGPDAPIREKLAERQRALNTAKRQVSALQRKVDELTEERDAKLAEIERVRTAPPDRRFRKKKSNQLSKPTLKTPTLKTPPKRHDTTRLERELEELEEDLEKATARLERAREAQAALQEQVKVLQARLSAIQRGPDPLAPLRDRVAQAERELNDHTRVVRERKRERDSARRALSDAEKRAQDHDRALNKAERAMTQARQQRLEADQRASTFATRLRSVSEWVDENVYSTFNYEVARWTRVCVGALDIDLHNRFKGDAPDAHDTLQPSARASTQDDAHPAHVRYGIAEDPLAYPKRSTDLIATVDRDLVGQLTRDISVRSQRYRKDLIRQAQQLADAEPERATRLYITAYLLDPSINDRSMRDHLAQYGLQRLDLLTQR